MERTKTMPELAIKQGYSYTYDDYCKWDDDKRWELIDGIAYAMSAPSVNHQRISRKLCTRFDNYLTGKKCEVFHAPIDVILNADGRNDTVVQPDLIIVCDSSKLDDKACKGAPDLIVEVLSPSTAKVDKGKKLKLYQNAGVKEYWIVDPDTDLLHVFTLYEGLYTISAYDEKDTVSVGIFEDCEINLKEIFDD